MTFERYIEVRRAKELIAAAVHTYGDEEIQVSQALGRVLADDVVATISLPPFDNSAMDGFAVQVADIGDANPSQPVRLQIVGEARAGEPFAGVVRPGQAARIMTGAAMPEGADTVVIREEVTEENGELVVSNPVEMGKNIRRVGEDILAGRPALPKGHLLTPPALGFLTGLGQTTVRVFKQPRVAVFITGDEVIEPGQELQSGEIWDSNSYSLAGALLEMGMRPTLQERIADDAASLHKAFERGLEKCDVIIVSGGVSVGDYDFVKDQARSLGVEPVFWGVRQKPGKPLFFGTRSGKVLFGLPGNPVSSLLAFYTYVRPFILSCMEHPRPELPHLPVVVGETLTKTVEKTMFWRVQLDFGEDMPVASLSGHQGSHVQKAFAEADGLLVGPPGIGLMTPGDRAMVILLPWFGRQDAAF